MAENQTKNPMELEPPSEEPITEEFHDAETVQGGRGPNLNGERKSEIHILVEITFRSNDEATKTSKKHLQLLHAMGQSFDKSELTMYNMKERHVDRDSLAVWQNVRNYSDNFTIHEGRHRHYVIFRTRTTKKFGEIKRARPYGNY
jgi:hypothetical protein